MTENNFVKIEQTSFNVIRYTFKTGETQEVEGRLIDNWQIKTCNLIIEIPKEKIISVNNKTYAVNENLVISKYNIKSIEHIDEDNCAIVVRMLPIKTGVNPQLHVNGNIDQRVMLKMPMQEFIELCER